MRYRLDVAFHGAEFHGWQRQPGLRTVQGELETWIARLLGDSSEVSVVGAGRTDAGVHATIMPTHFDQAVPIDADELYRRLQVALPEDLKALKLHSVADAFHARYSASSRRYVYRVRIGHWPFDRDREWQIYDELDLAVLQSCAELAIGTHDYRGFCLANSKKENNYCTVMESSWQQSGPVLRYTVRADRFLHEMVRLMVGTFVSAARGRWDCKRVADILHTGQVELCGDAAPSHGLTLEEVVYPAGIGNHGDFD
jgi:tRNA pseudouridine38-40 synthase